MEFLIILWYIIALVQGCISYGTAYRLTKKGGDNGLALFGWFFLLSFTILIPGWSVYLWYKYKEI